MPVVDLDDELSIVNEGLEEPPLDGINDSDDESEASPPKQQQQWIVDDIPNGNAGGASAATNPILSSRSETDDDSLYLMDADNVEKPIAVKRSQSVGGGNNKTSKQKKAPSSQDDSATAAYKQYMDVSGIVDNFGEEEEKEGWRKKMPSLLHNSNKAKDGANKNKTTDEDKTQQVSKESWRNKNPFRGKVRKSSSEQAEAKPAEANLAPLGNIDDIPPPKQEEVKKQEAGWMTKMSFLGKNKTEEVAKDDKFEDLYATNLAPLGGVDDVETSMGDEESCSEMTAVVSNKVKEETTPTKNGQENAKANDESADALGKSLGFAMSVMASLNIDTSSKKEQDSEDNAAEKKDETLQVKGGIDDVEEAKEEIVEESEGEFVGGYNDIEGELVGGYNDIEANEDDEDVMADVGLANGDLGADEGTDGTAKSKKTWKSKVKSVRKKSGLSSIRKKSSKLISKNFTQEKMKALEEAGDDKTIATLSTKRSVLSKKEQDDVVSLGGGSHRWRRRSIIIAAIAIVLMIIVIVAVATSRSKGNDSPPPKDVEYLYELVYPISGDALEVQDAENPLVKSFIWMAEDSKARPSDPDSETILRYVSAVVYFSLGGESWTNQNNFLSADDLCNWNSEGVSGILCEDGITEIQLPNNNLSGNIPEEIRHLSSLQHIVMANNTITGTLPSGIGELPWLEVLDVSSNAMSGFLSDSLFTYNQLREIIVSENNFSGEIDSSLGNSPVLERFSAFGNSFYGSLPASIGMSSVLKTVDFTANELTGPIPAFSSSSTIERLYVGMNNLDGEIPKSLARTPTLEFLHAQQNALTGTIPEFSTEGKGLRVIELSGNELEGNLAELLKSLPTNSMERIQLSNNKVTGTLPSSIGDYAQLQELHLAGNKLEGSIPLELGKLERMTGLRLRLNEMTGTIPSELGSLVLLTDLLLDSNNLEGEIPEDVANLPQLETLILSENNIDGGVAAVCARDAPLARFAVNTCGDDTVECPCCNVCCTSEPEYQCFQFVN